MNSINLNEQQLEALEEMAFHGFSIQEIAEVLCDEHPEDEFPMKEHTLFFADYHAEGIVHKTYRKGFLRSQLELRQRIFLDAKHGSSPAQAMAKKILDDQQYKMESE